MHACLNKRSLLLYSTLRHAAKRRQVLLHPEPAATTRSPKLAPNAAIHPAPIQAPDPPPAPTAEPTASVNESSAIDPLAERAFYNSAAIIVGIPGQAKFDQPAPPLSAIKYSSQLELVHYEPDCWGSFSLC